MNINVRRKTVKNIFAEILSNQPLYCSTRKSRVQLIKSIFSFIKLRSRLMFYDKLDTQKNAEKTRTALDPSKKEKERKYKRNDNLS